MYSVIWLLGAASCVLGAAENGAINFGGFTCPREETALGDCLKDALNTYIPHLAKGLPEFGVPPCEPLMVPSLTVQQSTGPVSVTSSYSDVTVLGPSTMHVENVKEVELAGEQVA